MKQPKLKKSCSNCINGTGISVNCDILCRIKGVVSSDYTCARHRLIPEAKSFKEQNLKCVECENFILEIDSPHDGPKIGLCHLFSVRQYDGRIKNACSKFVKRNSSESLTAANRDY